LHALLKDQKGGAIRALTPRAFDVLVFLIEHHRRVVEKKELFEQVWKESFVTDNASRCSTRDRNQQSG
jgi:DNA-binding winged helix-turn-helix (wHTH) protein